MTSVSSKPSSPQPADKADSDSPEGEGGEKDAEKGERIAKVLARAGVCSRREAERWIADGRVVVDNKVLTTPAFLVTKSSLIVVDGKPVGETQPTRLWRYHKPIGVLTTHNDPQGRPTVFERLPPSLGRVISIGRLDFNSEGLLLLTNDGALARRLELPTTGWTRRYRVRVHGNPTEDELAKLKRGIEIEGVRYGSIEATLDRQQGANAWVTLALNEGKNREIRKVMDHLGWPVTRLIRVAYGPFQLGNLERDRIDEVPGKVLTSQLGVPKRESMAKKNADRRRAS